MHARQLGEYNIRVNSISPGAIETDMGHHNMWYAGIKKKPANLDDPDRKLFTPQILERIPLHRIAEPGEIASIALFLATEGASYITGAIIVADGGLAV
jgi:NAD(P)-dependent dehydrogenase (short-subunit alcohol dehydrogenase family)